MVLICSLFSNLSWTLCADHCISIQHLEKSPTTLTAKFPSERERLLCHSLQFFPATNLLQSLSVLCQDGLYQYFGITLFYLTIKMVLFTALPLLHLPFPPSASQNSCFYPPAHQSHYYSCMQYLLLF